MKHLHRMSVMAAVGTALLFAGCGGGGGGGVAFAVLKGLVTNANGTAFAGVTVRSGTATTSSTADGSYSLSVTPGANLKVIASRAGFVDTFEVLSLAAGQTVPMDFSLNPIGQSTPLTSLLTTPATVTDPRGAEVTLAANTLVDSTGAAVDVATVEVTTGLPSDPKFTASFPGLFIGNQAGVDIDIESFGFVTIAITSNTGLACNLKPGATADIAIPVAPTADPGTPTIDLWSLNETTGKWTFEVAATRDASGGTTVYRAQVSHFSTYNLDRRIQQSVPFTITVRNSGGSPVAGASVVVTSTNPNGDGMWEGRGVSDANGTILFPNVPEGSGGFVEAHALAGRQVGSAFFYNLANGAATMPITVFTVVTRTFTAVYLNNGVQTPIPNQLIEVFQVDGNLGVRAFGTTNGNGQVTLDMEEGHASYQYVAHSGNIGGQFYNLDTTVNSLGAVPATWILQ